MLAWTNTMAWLGRFERGGGQKSRMELWCSGAGTLWRELTVTPTVKVSAGHTPLFAPYGVNNSEKNRLYSLLLFPIPSLPAASNPFSKCIPYSDTLQELADN